MRSCRDRGTRGIHQASGIEPNGSRAISPAMRGDVDHISFKAKRVSKREVEDVKRGEEIVVDEAIAKRVDIEVRDGLRMRHANASAAVTNVVLREPYVVLGGGLKKAG